jgi:hypothetical protein
MQTSALFVSVSVVSGEMWSSIIPVWIQAIAAVLGLVSVVLIYIQLRLDHERSQRTSVLDIQTTWATHQLLSQAHYVFAKRLIDQLSDHQCEQLVAGASFKVAGPEQIKCLKLFRKAWNCQYGEGSLGNCRTTKANGASGEDEVSCEESTVIRTLGFSFLNICEVVASAWTSGMVDTEMIITEFQLIFSGDNNQFPLKNLLKATHAFPSLKKALVHAPGSPAKSGVSAPPFRKK